MASISHHGRFQFTRVTVSLRKIPETFQRTRDIILPSVKCQHALIYPDDVVVFSKMSAKHIKTARPVVTLQRDAEVSLKIKSCEFFTSYTNYLGYVNRTTYLEITTYISDAIQDLRPSTTVGMPKQFLGMCNVFRQLVLNVACVAALFDQKL